MIEVVLKYQCGGCLKNETVTSHLSSHFVSLSGRSYGFGSRQNDKADAEILAPEGWVAFDPYTGSCYCPECWKGIENDHQD